MDDIVAAFRETLLSVDGIGAEKLALQNVDPKHPFSFVERVMVPVLEEIGVGWERGTYSLAHVYMSSRICERIADTILPPADAGTRGGPKTAIAVLNDHHLLGKKIVYSALRAGGFEVLDYGQCSVEEVLAGCERDDLEVLLISVLLYPSALETARVVEGLADSGRGTRVVVGGAPFRLDPDLYKRVGADDVGYSAFDALRIMRDIEGGGRS